MPRPRVAIIVLNWNQLAYSVECLESLRQVEYAERTVYLVDNASGDGSAEELTRRFPEVRVLRNRENLGVSGGRNVGLREALREAPDYLFFLDNDATAAPDVLDELVRAAEEHPRAGILGPKFYFQDARRRIWSAGGTIDLYRCDIRLRGCGEEDEGQYDRLEETEHVPGAGLMIRRRTLEEIGLLDEHFGRYFAEDTDWCLRARRRGWSVLYVPRARLWHRVSLASGGADFLFLKGRNLLYFMRRHARPHHWAVFIPDLAWGSLKVLGRETARGNLRGALAQFRGGLASLHRGGKRGSGRRSGEEPGA